MSRRTERFNHYTRCGFIIVELLVTIAIIAVLAALLLSSISRAKAHARQTECANNLKQLALGYLLYTTDHVKGPEQNEDAGLWMAACEPYYSRSLPVLKCAGARLAGAQRKAERAPKEANIPPNFATADELWFWSRPLNRRTEYNGGFTFNSWLYSQKDSAGPDPDADFRIENSGALTNPSETPVFSDGNWVDAAPRSTDRPGFNAYFGWNDGGIGRLFLARHGVRTPSRKTRPLEKPLAGRINMARADGHVSATLLVHLYRLNWHRSYERPTEGE